MHVCTFLIQPVSTLIRWKEGFNLKYSNNSRVHLLKCWSTTATYSYLTNYLSVKQECRLIKERNWHNKPSDLTFYATCQTRRTIYKNICVVKLTLEQKSSLNSATKVLQLWTVNKFKLVQLFKYTAKFQL